MHGGRVRCMHVAQAHSCVWLTCLLQPCHRSVGSSSSVVVTQQVAVLPYDAIASLWEVRYQTDCKLRFRSVAAPGQYLSVCYQCAPGSTSINDTYLVTAHAASDGCSLSTTTGSCSAVAWSAVAYP